MLTLNSLWTRRVLSLLTLWSVACSATRSSAQSSEKLQPLAYRHPDLVVDLGVGLWAYPMPLDYDGDGDLDLLVACPDKPSDGVYYFENPTQDPSIKMPVFKPAVRLGPGHHYMMLSQVDGEPVLLKPGSEYRRDPDTGKFDFDHPAKINARSNPNADQHGRTRANMWRYVDYDGDGDHDIVVGAGDWGDLGWDHAYDNRGVWQNGPLHGYLYLIRNEGTDGNPKYSNQIPRLHAGGGEIDVYGWPSPNFADFDGDGDLDLLCGEFMDGFTYFQNLGSRTEPRYAAGIKLNDDNGDPLVMHLQMITPTSIDWDGDGDFDLIVGDEDGRVALVENTGERRDEQPVFRAPVYFQQQADTLKFGALATPYAYDWDGDGDEDILCGNTAGEIGLFENLGPADENDSESLPKWAAPVLLNVEQDGTSVPFRIMAGENGSIQGPCEAKWGYTTLSVADWDGDGDGDIIYNSILSRLGLLIRDGDRLIRQDFDTGLSESPPAWYWWQTRSGSALTQWRTTPVAVDFNQDDALDLVLLDQEGYLTFRNRGGAAERLFVGEDRQPLQLNAGSCGRSGRVKLAVVDWDGDSRLDVLVNSENAMWYRNCATETIDGQARVVMKRVGNLATRNVAGHTSSPAVCDFDRDGKPDLLVGSENGRIYHVSHDECLTFSKEAMTLSPPPSTPQPRFPGWIKDEFIYTKASFKECHASTICQNSRGLVTAWFGGSKEGKEDVGIYTSYHDGLQWSGPSLVATGVQHDDLRYPCWNPVLFQMPGDGPTLLFFKVGPNPRSWWGEIMVSYDRGRTFQDRRRLPEGIVGPVRCKPVLLDDNVLLCGSSTEYDGWRIHFEKVSPVGEAFGGIAQSGGVWKTIGPINDGKEFNAIQPTLLKHGDGRLQVLCRTQENVVVSSFSDDDGATWSDLQAIDLPNPNSGIEAVTLTDGRHLLVYNPTDRSGKVTDGRTGWGGRGVLSLAVSNDGLSWSDIGILDEEKKAEFSYPAIIQADDGLVHITYTWKRERVKHVVIDPARIEPR
ncbi:exo-alpha-sialidase [Neorhodopirellula pilleata]|uniref:FG-GAP repeat protein n=1 Tax=Neorhodopirellula pilleata TaxID=2714738 RepID=A0A5C6A5L1_9BACT|nr:exo-alpha-sialidase [Neorhodopirellula pilleata]TWT93623.1 FG-GAP repeat protein [Neorhodopirellula pilleata]